MASQQNRCDELIVETREKLSKLTEVEARSLLACVIGTARFQRNKKTLEQALFYWPHSAVPTWLAQAAFPKGGGK